MDVPKSLELLASAGGGGAVLAIFQWWKDRRKNRADVHKDEINVNALEVNDLKTRLISALDENKVLRDAVKTKDTHIEALERKVATLEGLILEQTIRIDKLSGEDTIKQMQKKLYPSQDHQSKP